MDYREIEDFDITPATYQTMFHVFDKAGENIGTQVLSDHPTPEEAIDMAKLKVKEYKDLLSNCVYNWDGVVVYGAIITVETIVTVDGEEFLSGTLFNEVVYSNLG